MGIFDSEVFGLIITVIITSAIIWVELYNTFIIEPNKLDNKRNIYSLYILFILLNNILAIGLFYALPSIFKQINVNSAFQGLIVGLGYQVIIKAKIFTIEKDGAKIPIGLETLYEGIKDAFYKKINKIASKQRREKISGKVKQNNMKELVDEASAMIMADNLISGDRKSELDNWLRDLYREWNDLNNQLNNAQDEAARNSFGFELNMIKRSVANLIITQNLANQAVR